MGWEADVLLWIQDNIRCAFLTPIAKFCAFLGNHGELAIGLTLLLLIIPRTRAVGCVSFCSVATTYLFANLMLKNLVARTRPYDAIDGLTPVVAKLKDYSFPSGHAAITFACLFVVFLMMPKRYGIPALCMGIIMGLSRLYVGVHYPTDVIAGTAIGIGFAVIFTVIYKKKFAKAPHGEQAPKEAAEKDEE